MTKYDFARMGNVKFEHLVQGLLESERRGYGELIQFGSGRDGAREATWNQPPSHPKYISPIGERAGQEAKWVFQVKHHDVGARGWRGAADAVITDLKAELQKLTSVHQVECDHYVLVTNVPLSGVRHTGTRDKISEAKKRYQKKIPHIEVWDGTDVSRMLDANESVRSAYLDDLIPGDFLKSCLLAHNFKADRRESALRAYLNHVVDSQSSAKAQEAGDEGELPLVKVYIDLGLDPARESRYQSVQAAVEEWLAELRYRIRHGRSEETSVREEITASAAILIEPHPVSMILAGPGYGKSTITQFLVLYHASRLVEPRLAQLLAKRLRLPKEIAPDQLDAHVAARIPFKIDLRRFAKWQSTLPAERRPGHVADYIANQLINVNVSSQLTADDVFGIMHKSAILVVFDGLDEVPGVIDRDNVIKAIDAFLLRAKGESTDLQVVLSSRPQGYGNEFEKYEPLRWTVNNLDPELFNEYARAWLENRIRDANERADAAIRVERGMSNETVSRLASTLLQATVMLTIVKRKSEIPHERHKLYNKYVDVIFEREKEKWQFVAEFEEELRRLHELAGYELHKAVEAGAYKLIDPKVFRGMVLAIWDEYQGNKPHAVPLSDVVNEIISAATNRLVFLSGKGDEQNEIDFLIQSFREYFAASYMASHADADKENTLATLVSRGAFWSNVLQFYIGMSQPAEQIGWMYDISATSLEEKEIRADQIAIATRARRSLILCLPEFRKPSRSHYRQALLIALSRPLRWTWLDYQAGIAVLRALRPDETWAAVISEVMPFSENDAGELAAELQLGCELMSNRESDRIALANAASKLLLNVNARPIILHFAIRYSLTVDAGIVPAANQSEMLDEFIDQWHMLYQIHSRRMDTCSVSFSDEQLMELFCRSPYLVRMISNYRERLTQLIPSAPIRFNSLFADLDDPDTELQHSPLAPFLTRALPPDYTLPTRNAFSSLGTYSEYFYLLYASSLSPTDVDLYLRASRAERSLPRPPADSLTCNYFIGPHPAHFHSPADWVSFRVAVHAINTKSTPRTSLHELFLHSRIEAGSRLAWPLLLFSRRVWPRVVQTLPELAAPARALEPFDIFPTHHASAFQMLRPSLHHAVARVDQKYLAELCYTLALLALDICDTDGPSCLLHDINVLNFVVGSVGGADFQRDVNALITRAQHSAALPRSWQCFILSIGATTPTVHVDELLRLWAKLSPGVVPGADLMLPLGRAHPFVIKTIASLIQPSSALSTKLLYAYYLSSLSDPVTRLADPSTSIIIDLLSSFHSIPLRIWGIVVRAALHLPPSKEVYTSLFAFESIDKLVNSDDYAVSSLVAALDNFTSTSPDRRDISWMSSLLSSLIAHRSLLPPTLAKSAFELYQQLDALSQPPLLDSHWQLSRTTS